METTSMSLHIIAMTCMLCDHLWGTIVPGNDWLTCVGRISFPIFAFLIVEGYFHTRNLKYMYYDCCYSLSCLKYHSTLLWGVAYFTRYIKMFFGVS